MKTPPSRLPLLLGESPGSFDQTGEHPLRRGSRTLCALAGIQARTRDGYYAALKEYFDVQNLYDRKQDCTPWSRVDARRRGLKVFLDWDPDPPVLIMLGRKVAAAFEWEEPWGRWQPFDAGGKITACVLPHPSGRNRLMNDPMMRVLCASVLLQTMEGRVGRVRQ